MANEKYHFQETCLLVTHYNRSLSLERLLNAFRNLNCSFGEIVVSDDGSKQEHLQKLQQLQKDFSFRLITTPVNKGLGHNNNKGQDAVTAAFTLYVQEDFEPASIFPRHLTDAIAIMEERDDLDIIKFYAYFKYPYTKPYGKGFSEMVFHAGPWYTNHLKFYFYSDHPHLRRSNFFEKFGRYPEGVKGDTCEYQMSLSFIRQKAKGLFYDHFTELFYQKNSPDEPSTMQRSNWRQNKNPLTSALRFLYLKVKFIRWSFDLIYPARNNK